MIWYLITVLLQFVQKMCRSKNFENRLIFGEDVDSDKVKRFFLRHSVCNTSSVFQTRTDRICLKIATQLKLRSSVIAVLFLSLIAFLDCYICCLLAQFLELILHFKLLLTLVLLWNQCMTLIRSWHMALYQCVWLIHWLINIEWCMSDIN